MNLKMNALRVAEHLVASSFKGQERRFPIGFGFRRELGKSLLWQTDRGAQKPSETRRSATLTTVLAKLRE